MALFVGVGFVFVVGFDLRFLLFEEEHSVSVLTFAEGHAIFGFPGFVAGVVLRFWGELCQRNGQNEGNEEGFVHHWEIT